MSSKLFGRNGNGVVEAVSVVEGCDSIEGLSLVTKTPYEFSTRIV
nr:hypothetical protein JVH1_4136 [Rhodococcus sp. JVH1]